MNDKRLIDRICKHVPNGLRALNEDGLMVCAKCGHGYDHKKEE